MADESQNLLETLTGHRLPALPESHEPEPREPSEPTESRDLEQGRRPEDVVQAREERQPAETTQEPEEVGIPAAPRKAKGKPEVKTYEIDGKKYTLAELEASGLLEKQIQTARQFEPLQQKYFKQLEEQKAAPAKTEEAPAEVPAITNLAIARAYDDIAQTIINDLITNGKLLEEDFVEAWPRAVKTMVGQLRFLADKIFENEAKLHKVIERAEGVITYLNANKAQTEGSAVAAKYNRHLDALVAKDGKLYAGLKDQGIRDNFTKYLVEELGANIEQTTDDKKAPVFLGKQWVAFNAQVIMDAAKNGTADKQKQANKRFVVGEGTGSRPATPEESPELLDRMIERSGRIRE